MSNATVDDASLAAAPATPRRGRVWPPLAAVGAFWILTKGLEQTSLPISSTFMTSFIARVALLLVFLVWWFAFRGASWKEKFGGFAVALIFGAAVGWLSRNTLGPFVLIFTAVPILITVWVLWAAAARWLSSPWRQIGFVTAISLVWF